ncbi:MAG: hypothetical protein RI842_09810 [Schleiferiaceae bacterium]|nr:hypothetical protein [Schleiferiaceae bacterium]
MKALTKAVSSIILLTFFISCEEEKTSEVGGHFKFILRTDKDVNRMSLFYSKIEALDANGVDLDHKWKSVDTESGLKKWKSQKLLYGTYRFDYYIEHEDENGRTNTYGPFEYTFQIFPGKTTRHTKEI